MFLSKGTQSFIFPPDAGSRMMAEVFSGSFCFPWRYHNAANIPVPHEPVGATRRNVRLQNSQKMYRDDIGLGK